MFSRNVPMVPTKEQYGPGSEAESKPLPVRKKDIMQKTASQLADQVLEKLGLSIPFIQKAMSGAAMKNLGALVGRAVDPTRYPQQLGTLREFKAFHQLYPQMLERAPRAARILSEFGHAPDHVRNLLGRGSHASTFFRKDLSPIKSWSLR